MGNVALSDLHYPWVTNCVEQKHKNARYNRNAFFCADEEYGSGRSLFF